MRTGSHLQARFTGRREAEFTWFPLGASLPLISMDAERAARQIVEAMRRRKPELILTPLGQLGARGGGIVPELTVAPLHLMQQPLPAATGQRNDPVPGHDLRPALNRQLFDRATALGRRAAR
jgi:hypothetical protein